MSTLIEKLKNEPAVLISTVFAFLAYFGVRLSEDQVSTVSQLVTILGPIVAGLLIRSKVTPVNDYFDIETEGHPGNPLG